MNGSRRATDPARLALSALVAVLLTAVVSAGPAHAAAGLPGEPANVAKSLERPTLDGGVGGGQVTSLLTSPGNVLGAVAEQLADPQRLFITNVCGSGIAFCQGDVRLSRWAENGYGLVEQVRYTARNGAVINGHVWATRAGAPQRPVVAITPGSVQASEQLYWFAAQVLAKAGYVVLTHDDQQQGGSGALGAGPDLLAGFPAQLVPTTFFDGTQDAIDFALSTPSTPYCPRPSRTGVEPCAGAPVVSNPFAGIVDQQAKVGLAGHSYGGFGVSYVGQQDPRVGAVVAWDNLCVPGGGPTLYSVPNVVNGVLGNNLPAVCPTGSQPPVPALRTPALGISGDYLLAPTPYLAPPDPLAKSTASLALTAAGVDTGQIIVRGATHYDFSSGAAFPATLRGLDLTSWYTTAWFDKYLRGDRGADARLLTTRWRADPLGAAVDTRGDGNDFSYHYRSRLDIRDAAGARVRCENLREGCPHLQPDGAPDPYSFLPVVTTKDTG